jgi:pyruvate kinase
MKLNRHCRIICTLGPACDSEEMLAKMASRGMNVARINSAHGSEAQHQKMINLLRTVNKKHGYDMTLLQDLTGYRIRVSNLHTKKILGTNEMVTMSHESEKGADHIPFDYPEPISTIKRGYDVFIDDGRIHLKVLSHHGKRLKLKVIQGGLLKERKGINIPMLKLQSNIMTEQDVLDLEFAIKNKVEKIAQSFVRNKKDIQRVADIVRARNPKCKVFAKIESEEGVRNIDSILEACDGIMVARGDLGVTLPLYKIPVIQKYLIKHCNRQKKLSITATQMLESMITDGRPTRAEVSDVANAILDGSDYVMLSGETSVGKYPSRSVKYMSQIIEYTERYSDSRPN